LHSLFKIRIKIYNLKVFTAATVERNKFWDTKPNVSRKLAEVSEEYTVSIVRIEE
jgi:hypothetical protein